MTIFSVSQTNAFRKAVSMIRKNKSAFIGNILFFTLVFCLPLFAYIIFYNLYRADQQLDYRPTVSVYFANNINAQQLSDAKVLIGRISGVKDSMIIKKEETLAKIKADPTLADSVVALTANPFPDVIVVTPKTIETAKIKAMLAEIQKLKFVEAVDFDTVWAKQFDAITYVFSIIAIVLMALFILAVCIVSINIARTEYIRHSREMALIQLLGGLHSALRKPLIMYSFFLGIIGTLIALGLAFIATLLIAPEIDYLTKSYQGSFTVLFIPIIHVLIIAFIGGLLSAVCAWLAGLFSKTDTSM